MATKLGSGLSIIIIIKNSEKLNVHIHSFILMLPPIQKIYIYHFMDLQVGIVYALNQDILIQNIQENIIGIAFLLL